jgi:hypothetical protein
MGNIQASNQLTPCDAPLPDLELPMITSIVSCLRGEHGKLDILNLNLALAATGLARDPESASVKQRALELWDEIRRVLWSHLQIENELVLSWGGEHRAISDTLLNALKAEFQQMRSAVAVVSGSSSVDDGERRDGVTFARKLLAVTHVLDSHLERYEREVLPSILRALFHGGPAKG